MPQNQVQLEYTQPAICYDADAPLMSEDIERESKGLGEKLKGGAKAAGEKISDTAKDAGEKISDTGKDAEAEARKAKENVKEKVD
jgi:hypothetical protein